MTDRQSKEHIDKTMLEILQTHADNISTISEIKVEVLPTKVAEHFEVHFIGTKIGTYVGHYERVTTYLSGIQSALRVVYK